MTDFKASLRDDARPTSAMQEALNEAESRVESVEKDVCFLCNGHGHWARECTSLPSGYLPEDVPICYECGGRGHFARACATNYLKKARYFALHGYQPGAYFSKTPRGTFGALSYLVDHNGDLELMRRDVAPMDSSAQLFDYNQQYVMTPAEWQQNVWQYTQMEMALQQAATCQDPVQYHDWHHPYSNTTPFQAVPTTFTEANSQTTTPNYGAGPTHSVPTLPLTPTTPSWSSPSHRTRAYSDSRTTKHFLRQDRPY